MCVYPRHHSAHSDFFLLFFLFVVVDCAYVNEQRVECVCGFSKGVNYSCVCVCVRGRGLDGF